MTSKLLKEEIYLATIDKRVECDPTILSIMRKLFDWSNEMGLKGLKVSHLSYDCTPTGQTSVTCTIFFKDEGI